MDRSTLQLLISPEGRALISAATAELAAGTDSLAVLSRLRTQVTAETAREMLVQAELRKKAEAKLGARGAGLVLLPDSLEQASRAEVADSRARRLLAAGVRSLTDAGAGLGADTLAYAAAGLRVRAIERDPDVAAVLRANVSVRGADVEVLEGDAMGLLPESGVVYFDPARRADGRRIFDPELCSPPLSALVAAHRRGLTVVAKMSPSLGVDDVPPGWDADWVSTQTEHGRTVVEAVLWSPPLGTGVRRAIVLDHDAEHRLASAVAPDARSAAHGEPVRAAQRSDADRPQPQVGPIGRFLYEPDGAVNQAGLGAELSARLDAWPVEPRIAYLTGDSAVDTPFAHRYEVLEQLPWSKRGLARALSGQDASDLVIKKRGITVDPTALRKELLRRLRSRTGEPLVVILTPHRGDRLALLARAC